MAMRSLREPLLQKEKLDRCSAPPPRRPSEEKQLEDFCNDCGSSIVSTVINLLKNMVGAGLLNVCIAFRYASVIGGLLAMVFSAFVCTAGFLMIGYCCSKTRAKTFRELFRLSIGARYEKVVDIMLFFHCFFSCVGYVTLVGDFSQKSCAGLFPHSIFATSRSASVYVITVFCFFPLSLLRNLDKLKYTSAAGLGVTAFACSYVFYDCIANSAENGSMDVLRDHAWYFRFDIFKAIALFNGSFSAHYNAPTYYAELRRKSFRRYAQATLYAFAIATVLFTTFGLAGFARYGDDVLGNVLKNYSAEDPMVQVSWMCMMVSTIFVFPHAFQRMRSSWTALVNKPANLRARSSIPVTTIALLACTVYFGVAFEDIAVIKMIKGATLGVSIMFILPGLIYLRLSSKDPGRDVQKGEPVAFLRGCCKLMIVVGIIQGLMALASYYKLI